MVFGRRGADAPASSRQSVRRLARLGVRSARSAPEQGQAFGARAKQATSELAFGKEVRVETRTTDRYGRMVGEVFLPGGKSLNRELVKLGMAWWYRKYSTDASIGALEDQASAAKRGLWADPDPVPPWEWRHPNR